MANTDSAPKPADGKAAPARCSGYIPMAGFGETRCKRCGIPLDRHPVVAQ